MYCVIAFPRMYLFNSKVVFREAGILLCAVHPFHSGTLSPEQSVKFPNTQLESTCKAQNEEKSQSILYNTRIYS